MYKACNFPHHYYSVQPRFESRKRHKYGNTHKVSPSLFVRNAKPEYVVAVFICLML